MSHPYEQVNSAGGGDRKPPAACKDLCLRCCCIICCAIPAVYVALRRNYNCNPEALSLRQPPYGGELMPRNITLKERRNAFQWSKLVDVYDASNDTHIGYFYDMNFFFFMRFGFSDASDEIWFEAKYMTLWARLGQFGDQYYLQRCDVGAGGRHGATYSVIEDYWARPWFCYNNCFKRFALSRHADRGRGSDVATPIAEVLFNSTLDWYNNGWSSRHQWYMKMDDPQHQYVIASAKQRFAMQQRLLGNQALSVWSVTVEKDETEIPNWVIAFMAALDDIEESDE